MMGNNEVKTVRKHMFFIQLDFSESYLKNLLAEEHTKIVCVSIKGKHWELLRCPFGLLKPFERDEFVTSHV
jgi:hypothetical protein